MKKIKLLILILSITLLNLVGCSILPETQVEQSRNYDISRTVVISNIDEYKESMLKIIKSGIADELFIEDFYFNSDDILMDANINNSYIFNNAIYIQTNDKYMYRFQLDNQTKLIESYIRYQLEG